MIIIIVVIIVAVLIFQKYDASLIGGVRQFNRQNEPYDSGSLEIGGKMPWGPGDSTFAPYLEIPASQKFYVSVAEPNTWCINEDCSIDGAIIQTLGGWLQVENTRQSEVEALFGLDLPENKDVKSIVLVGDNNGKIVGIYPNKGLRDIIPILKLHPDLADFNFLEGVNEFGFLKVGKIAPLKPGDDISGMSEEFSKFSTTNIPKDKKFYLYALQHRKDENKYVCFLGGCRYSEPDHAHDFLFDEINNLNGWFLANDEKNIKMVKLFGLNQKNMSIGKSSLVVLTDARGIIVAIHPNKTIGDAITILSQHPDIVDIKSLY